MTILSLLKARREESIRLMSAEDRKARRRGRPMLESLEKREVFTAGIAAPFVGPVMPPAAHQPAAVSTMAAPAAASSTPAPDSQGFAFGMNYRLHDNGDGSETLFVEDMNYLNDAYNTANKAVHVYQSGNLITLGTDPAHVSGPIVTKAGDVVNLEVDQHYHVAGYTTDFLFMDGRSASQGKTTFEQKDQAGRINVPYGYLAWNFHQDIVTQTGSFSVASGTKDTATYGIQAEHLTLNDTPDQAGSNTTPIVGIEVSDSENDSGGVSFDAGMNVSVSTSGGATWAESLS